MKLEIFCDASIKRFNNGRVFGCSGALCSTTQDSRYIINPDSTNNKSELLAVFIGLQMARDIILYNNIINPEVYIYSDSQFTIFGLTRWINGWIRTIQNNIIYGSNKEPVKNQELFAMILRFLIENNMPVKFLHQKGHINYNKSSELIKANEVFKTSNGYYLSPEEIYKISYYNDIVDKTSRSKLDIDSNNFIERHGKQMVELIIPTYKEYNKFVL